MHPKMAQVEENHNLLQSKEYSYKKLLSKNYINFFSKWLCLYSAHSQILFSLYLKLTYF